MRDRILRLKVINGCGFGLKHCNENNPCPLHNDYAPIRDAINKLLSEETIQGLVQKNPGDRKITLNRLAIDG